MGMSALKTERKRLDGFAQTNRPPVRQKGQVTLQSEKLQANQAQDAQTLARYGQNA
jgi:hypothetical protein